MAIFQGILSVTYLSLLTIVACTPLYVMGLVRLLVPLRSWQRMLSAPMDSIIDFWVSGNRLWNKTFNLLPMLIETDGMDFSRGRWYVVVSNHQSWTDIMVLQQCLRPLVPPLKFFTKRELIWVPGVGLAMWFLGFPYVFRFTREQAEQDPSLRVRNEKAMAKSAQRFADRPICVLSFVEGTRFTQEKHARTQSHYKHLLKPKVGGIVNTLSSMEGLGPAVLNATISYKGSVPGFWQYLCGTGRGVKLYLQAESTPTDLGRDSVSDWIDDLWSKKDDFLARSPAVDNRT